jgi:hypothetical protein
MEDQYTRDTDLEMVEFYWQVLPLPARIKFVTIAWLIAFAQMRKSLYILIVLMASLTLIVLAVDNKVVGIAASITMGVILGATIVYWLLRDFIHKG